MQRKSPGRKLTELPAAEGRRQGCFPVLNRDLSILLGVISLKMYLYLIHRNQVSLKKRNCLQHYEYMCFS